MPNKRIGDIALLFITFICVIGFSHRAFAEKKVFAPYAEQGEWEIENTGIYGKLSGVLLLLINVFVFDLFMISQEVCEKNNHVPAFLLGIFLCYPLSINPLHPLLFAQLLLSASMWYFISTYKSDKTFSAIFNGAFCLSIADIFYPPFIVFLGMCFICILLLRSLVIREWILALTGIFLPYFFYVSLLFLFNKNMQQPALNLANSFHAPSIPAYMNGSFLINFLVALIAVFALMFFLTKTISNVIKTRKSFVIFLWLAIISIPTWFIVSTGGAFSFLLSAMPLSVFCGIYLGNTKRRIFAELLLWSLLSAFVTSMLQQASII